MSQPTSAEPDTWTDLAEEGATFAPLTVDTTDPLDYEKWALEDGGWRKLLAAVNGGSAYATTEGHEAALERVDSGSLFEASAAFQHTYEALSWLETFVRDHSNAIAGPERAWQGAAADAFIAQMETFSAWLGAQAERIGSGGEESIPHQLFQDGAHLFTAQQAMHVIDTEFAAMSYAQDPARRGENGNIAITGTSLEKPMAKAMRDVIRDLAKQYDEFPDPEIKAPPDHEPPITSGSLATSPAPTGGPPTAPPPPPTIVTPPVPSFTTPPVPSFTTPPVPSFSTPPLPSVKPPSLTPPPNVTPPQPPGVPPPLPSFTPPPMSAGSGGTPPTFTPPTFTPAAVTPPAFPPPPGVPDPPNGGTGGGLPNLPLPTFPGAGGGLPGLDTNGRGGGTLVPPSIPPAPGNGGRNESNTGAFPPAPGAGGGIPGVGGLGLPGGMPFVPGGAGGGAPGGPGAGIPEAPDANGLLGGDEGDWRPVGVDGIEGPSAIGGAPVGGAGLGMPGGFPGAGMPGPGMPGGGAGIPELPDANGLVVGDVGDWQPGGAYRDGDPDAPLGVSAGGVGLDVPTEPETPVLPRSPGFTPGEVEAPGWESGGDSGSTDPAAPAVAPQPVGVPQVVPPLLTRPAGSTGHRRDPGGPAGDPNGRANAPADEPTQPAVPAAPEAPDGTSPGGAGPVGEPSLPVVPLAGAAYGVSVPGIGPDVPQPLAVAGAMPGRPSADDAGDREEPERPESAELLAEEAETWAADSVDSAGGEVLPSDDHVPVVRPGDGDDDTTGWDDVADSWWLTDDDEERDQEGKPTDV